MRYVNGLLGLVLVAFAAVQYNDPDVVLWAPVYLVPAAWSALAAWRPARLRAPGPLAALGACIVAAIAATVHFWPTEPGFWHRAVWWESETAREGMGLMVVTLALLSAALAAALAPRAYGENSSLST